YRHFDRKPVFGDDADDDPRSLLEGNVGEEKAAVPDGTRRAGVRAARVADIYGGAFVGGGDGYAVLHRTAAGFPRGVAIGGGLGGNRLRAVFYQGQGGEAGKGRKAGGGYEGVFLRVVDSQGVGDALVGDLERGEGRPPGSRCRRPRRNFRREIPASVEPLRRPAYAERKLGQGSGHRLLQRVAENRRFIPPGAA